MKRTLHVLSYNLHKGLSGFNARLLLSQQRDLIRHWHPDIVFLQEVCGQHVRHQPTIAGSQYEYLADSVWQDYAYGKNAVHEHGHHGNAILSKYPIVHWQNEDVSAHVLEQRGLLHCEIAIPNWQQSLHCVCVHLGLLASWRKQQIIALQKRIQSLVPADAPLIIAGDFNDWRLQAGRDLASQLHLREVFEHSTGKPARSFPAMWPVLRLDRIYTRGFDIQHSQVHAGERFARTSDHVALSAKLVRA